MIYLLQLLRRLNKDEQILFINLFNDLSFEIKEMGYKGHESELMNELLLNHFDLEIESETQLNMFTNCILRYQGRLIDWYSVTSNLIVSNY